MCFSADCGTFPEHDSDVMEVVENGNDAKTTVFNSTVTYKCLTGYYIMSDVTGFVTMETIRCTEAGTWEALPTCTIASKYLNMFPRDKSLKRYSSYINLCMMYMY